MKKESKKLYHKLTEVLVEHLESEYKRTGVKIYQSEVVGVLEMLKVDWYMAVSSERVVGKVVSDMLDKWKNKRVEVDYEGGITIVEMQRKKLKVKQK